MLTCTKLDVLYGFVGFVRREQIWNPTGPVEGLPAPIEQCELTPRFTETNALLSSDIHAVINSVANRIENVAAVAPLIYLPPVFTEEQANEFLRFGWQEPYDDSNVVEKHRSGEGLILHYHDIEPMKRSQQLQIYSPAYAWRKTIRGEEPSLAHTFYLLTDDTSLPEHEFRQKYPALAPLDLDKLIVMLKVQDETGHTADPIITWPSSLSEMPTDNKISRLEIIWASLLISCYPGDQIKVLPLLEQYLASRNRLIDILTQVHDERGLPENIRELLGQINERVKRNKQEAYRKTTQGGKKQANLKFEDLRYNAIQHIVYETMSGADLYRVLKYFEKNKKRTVMHP